VRYRGVPLCGDRSGTLYLSGAADIFG